MARTILPLPKHGPYKANVNFSISGNVSINWGLHYTQLGNLVIAYIGGLRIDGGATTMSGHLLNIPKPDGDYVYALCRHSQPGMYFRLYHDLTFSGEGPTGQWYYGSLFYFTNDL